MQFKKIRFNTNVIITVKLKKLRTSSTNLHTSPKLSSLIKKFPLSSTINATCSLKKYRKDRYNAIGLYLNHAQFYLNQIGRIEELR
ncbi:MAG: hypothetical protein KAV01_00520 [Candidatus Lokiarchaeota archaeon]|nr:hypothetical protein [Candidatus Lokiarchaeota archaeon]